jgi:hypothetical protein
MREGLVLVIQFPQGSATPGSGCLLSLITEYILLQLYDNS